MNKEDEFIEKLKELCGEYNWGIVGFTYSNDRVISLELEEQ